MRRKGTRLIPARIVAPGTLVRKELDSRGWTQEDLARIMDRPVQVISEIVAAKKQITPETALGLAGAFGTSAEMWLEMEAAYRLKLARKTGAMADVERRGRIYSAVPVKELVRRGWIEDCDEVDDLQAQVEAFLDVSSLDELRPLRVAARRTASKEPDPRGCETTRAGTGRAWSSRPLVSIDRPGAARFERWLRRAGPRKRVNGGERSTGQSNKQPHPCRSGSATSPLHGPPDDFSRYWRRDSRSDT